MQVAPVFIAYTRGKKFPNWSL